MPNEQAAWDALHGDAGPYAPQLWCDFVKAETDEDGWDWGLYRVVGSQRLSGRWPTDLVSPLAGRFEKYIKEHQAEILKFCGFGND